VHEGLQRALDRCEFVLHFQPLMDLHTGNIESVEALVRWQHPDKGFIPPAEFIPVAEDTGLMLPIGKFVLETALREASLCRLDSAPIRVAVNVSARQFHDPSFVQHLRSVLKSTGIAASGLELEVTESVAMEDEAGNAILRKCKDVGVGISLDDFGTHYSSLAYLKRLPIDTIKIDRSFVSGLPANVEDVAIVKTIIALGRNLKRRIIAEGVENAEQLQWLKRAGCDVAQGFYISKPMPIAELIAWMEQRPPRVRYATS
jgi:EAL domain-containing protein (putative c-di-GMP-specific phosphodiesterase class I)